MNNSKLKGILTAILLIICALSFAQTYYSKSTGDLHNVSTWGQNSDGTGTEPTNFTSNNIQYIIANRTSVVLTANWTISGTNSKVIAGNSIDSITFTIPSAYTYTGTIDVANKGKLEIANTTNPTLGTMQNGSTVVFCSKENQNIPAVSYYNLHTEIGRTKTLSNNTTVRNKLRIGAITTFNAASYNLYLTGEESIVTLIGTFDPGTSTVYYNNTANTTICAMDYHNLNISGGPRTLQNKNIIGITGAFTPGSGPFTISNSTIEYKGSSAQNITNFTYYNLRINNNAGLTMAGGASTITNNITFINGKVTTSPTNTLTVTNPSQDAVSYGNSSSYIIGTFTRSIEANLSNSMNRYIFPVGNSSNYYEFILSKITTGVVVPVVSVTYNASNEWATSISTGSVSSTSISVTLPSTPASNACIVYSSTSGGAGTNIFGTVSGNSIVYTTNAALQNFYRTSTRTVSTQTYVYCSGDVHNANNWKLTNCSGTALPNFTGNDRVYVINNTSATLTSNLAITGHNVTFQIGSGSATSLTVNFGVTLSLPGNILMQQGSTLTNNGTISAAGNISYSNFGYLNYIDIQNNGLFNVYGNITQNGGSFSRIYNNATGILNLYGNYTKDQNTWFSNSGLWNIYSGSFSSTSNSQNYFTNEIGGIVNVYNKLAQTKSVIFNNIFTSDGFYNKVNSIFNVENANIVITASGTLPLEGKIQIQDGNLLLYTGGLTINISDEGGLYLIDSDNNSDGIIDLNWGGITLNNDGEAYVEGLKASVGGGTTINVNDGANMFIGNVGLYTGINNNSIQVYNGGNLYYCGNKTPVNEQLGTIHTGGTLNFALGYYTTETPGNQGDFSVSGNETAAFENAEVCRDAFYGGTPFGDELLPIELTMLHATCSNGTIHIAWQTASEQNNDFFTIYRSFDGMVFTAIATVSGAGNSNSLLNYMYDDNTLAQGIVYYKLAQTDYDGKTVYSKILAVSTCGNPAIYSFKEGEITISFEKSDIPNHILITSIDGKILFSKVYTNTDSATIYTPFANGIYVISTVTNNSIISEKFVIKN
ncbi:MAG: hypothetical protein BWY22_01711 [Bacteroidetes bacterium ADurb.Bin217]|nr:MAG: hypothetical protein BWY22_01711 [Bacteroidetes bacterium ADurb.Bin217]